MPFTAVCIWSFGRSLLVALAAWPVCARVEQEFRGASPARGRWLVLALPFLMPELLVGYLVAPFVAGFPWRSEGALFALLFLRSVPVGVIALRATPGSLMSPAAMHVRRMSCRTWRDRWELARCYLHGPIRRALPALGLMFLINFQEFEAAAMQGSLSWTDWLFVQHATGMSLVVSLRFLVGPLAIQLAVLLAILWSVAGLSRENESFEDDASRIPTSMSFSWTYILAACLIGVVLPLGLLSRELADGWRWLMSQPAAWKALGREIATAGLVGLVAGLTAWNVCRLSLCERKNRRHIPYAVMPAHGVCGRRAFAQHKPRLVRYAWHVLISLPGLFGGLTIGLALLWLSTRPMMQPFSSTPVFWVLALTIWLLPRAVLLQLWLARQTDPASLHLVELLSQSPEVEQRRIARRWNWQWRFEPQIAACGLLCYWAYLDLTSAALLAPPGMASVVVRLYNFMHFGHSAAMSMEAAIVMLLPLALWGFVTAVARSRLWVRW
jgi:hypothetical protein